MHKDDLPSNLPSVENADSSAVPSDSATMDFPADGEHQGIFSSNDTRIEIENLPDIPEVAQQAPINSISPALRTESSVTGDLKLGNAPKKKKWPLVVLGGVVVAAIGAAMWLLISNSNIFTSQEKTAYGVTEESKRLFNRYINFLLDDNDTSDKPNLLDFLANDYMFLSPGAMFAEKIKLDSDLDSARAYFNDLNALYGEFSQKFFSPDADPDEAPEGYSRNAVSDYFFEAAKGSYWDLDKIVALYAQNGEASTYDILEGTLKSDSENATVQSILEARKKQLDLYLKAIVQSSQAGCIVDGSLERSCARPYFEEIDDEVIKLVAQIDKLEMELREKAIASLENIYYAFYPDDAVTEGGSPK